MATQSSSDAAFLEHTAHYITKARNSSKAEDCISLPKGIIVNMASGSRVLKPAEKSDGGKKASHPKMAAYHGINSDEGREAWRKREQTKSLSSCGKAMPRKENWRPLVSSWSSPQTDDQPSRSKKRLLFVDVGECKSAKFKIPNRGEKFLGNGSQSEGPLKLRNHLVCPKKSSRHMTSNAVRTAMESRSDREKRRKGVVQFEVRPKGGDNKDERNTGPTPFSKSNTVLLRKYFLLWRKFVVLRVLKSTSAKNLAKDKLLRRYFLMWRKSVDDKRTTLRHCRFLKNSKCSLIQPINAYYALRLLSKYFHRWKWWTRWHQRRTSRERRDSETTKKVEAFFSQQRPKCESFESRNLVMEVPPCMSSSTHLIMDALSEVRRQGYFDVPDVTIPPLVLFQPKSKIEHLVTVKENSTELKTLKPSSKPLRVTTTKIEKSPRGKRPRSSRATTAGGGITSSSTNTVKTRRKVLNESKGQQMVRAMELRAAERKKRLAALMERKREAAEDKLAMARKQKETEMELEKIEKRRRREAYEDKIRAHTLQTIEKIKRHQLDEENFQLAQQHYFLYLKHYAMRRWRAYVSYRNDMAYLVQEYRKRLALAYGIRLWEKLSFKRSEEKVATAEAVYQNYLKKFYFNKWKDFQMVHHILEAFAHRHFAVKFGRKVLQAWHSWSQQQLPLHHAQEKNADELLNRKLLKKILRQWIELPKILHAERIREERLNKLREKVQELLPDFSPSFDKLVLSNVNNVY